MDETQKILEFNINVPGYIPEGYELSGVYIRNPDSGMSPVQLLFSLKESNGYITVEQQPIVRSAAFSHNFRENDAQVKTVELNGSEATLIYFYKNGVRQLMWQSPTMYYIINGPLTEDEIIKVGLSVK